MVKGGKGRSAWVRKMVAYLRGKLRSAAEEQPKPVPGLEARVVQRGVEPHCPINPPGWMRHHTYT